ncbi:UNVERIFIED_CONTAM: hypothetical protein FKN15_006567 [Acipenser sinensis]
MRRLCIGLFSGRTCSLEVRFFCLSSTRAKHRRIRKCTTAAILRPVTGELLSQPRPEGVTEIICPKNGSERVNVALVYPPTPTVVSPCLKYLETHPDARKRYITKNVMVLTQSPFSDKMENGTADENMQKRSVSIDIKGDDKKELQHQKKNRSGQDNIKKTTEKSKKKMTETGNKKTTEKTQSKTSSNNSSTCTLL